MAKGKSKANHQKQCWFCPEPITDKFDMISVHGKPRMVHKHCHPSYKK